MFLFKRCCLLIAVVFALSSLSAQQSTRLIKGWEFLRQDLGGIWEAVRSVGKGQIETVYGWQPVQLPHCINAEDAVDTVPGYYQGPAWYRTLIPINNPYTNGRTLLHFEGAGQKTQVWIYTTLVDTHTGGYDEFTIDITEAVAAFKKTAVFHQQFKGAIPISIRTDNSRDLEMIPSNLADFTIYGGIYRYLNLDYEPAVSIDKFMITPVTAVDGKTAKLQAATSFYNPTRQTSPAISFRLLDPQGKQLAIQKDVKDEKVSFQVNHPQLWSPDNPRLYTLEATIGDYTRIEKFAFRSFEFVKHGPFLLNGKRLLLRGTHRHEDHAGIGSAMTEDMMRQEMIMMKEMGVNFIRLGHYQQSRIILNLCDSLGIMVWEEIPWCRGGLGGLVYQEQAKRMLTNMIHQHYNHPSVIIWGLGNENDWPGDFPEFDTLKIRTFMKELNDLAHSLDNTRKTAIRRCDFCKDIVDVYSPSIWAGWYRGIYTEYKKVSEDEMKKVDHFLHVEWGGDSHARRHSENPDKVLQQVKASGKADERAGDALLFGGAARVSKDGDWSESYICNLIDWHLKEQETMAWLTGTAQWPFKDFATPGRPENPVPYVNQKGVIERDFTKKEAYYVFQSYWAAKPMAHIYGHTWPVRWGSEGEEKMIKVYSNCDEATLWVDGKSYGTKKRNSQDFPAAGLRWNVPLSNGKHAVSVTAKKGKTVVNDSISFTYQTAQWTKPVFIKLNTIRNENDTALIEARVVDINNVQCLDATNWIHFDIAGNGKLIDNQGTGTGSSLLQLYNGRALIKVNLNKGHSMFSASVNGLPAEFLYLKSTINDPFGTIKQTLFPSIMEKAGWALKQQPVTVTASFSDRSAGGRHDFFSEGDYWWPNPKGVDSPWISIDGKTNPGNFVEHRHAMIRFSEIVGSLASAYLITGDDKYARQILLHCKAWFMDTATRMNPNLLYSQAVKNRYTGRSYGVIDGIHLMEVAKGLEVVEKKYPAADKTIINASKQWFNDFLQWLSTHKYGVDEKNALNNHSVCWAMQVAVFANFAGNKPLLDTCRNRFKNIILPRQMAVDGSLPLELARTKPYGYSIFNLDAMATLAQELSTPADNLWDYEYEGRSLRKGISFLYPYIVDKSKWTWPKDIMYYDNWPVAQPFLIFGAVAYDNSDWLKTWQSLEHVLTVEEVIRNVPVRNPLIWFNLP